MLHQEHVRISLNSPQEKTVITYHILEAIFTESYLLEGFGEENLKQKNVSH